MSPRKVGIPSLGRGVEALLQSRAALRQRRQVEAEQAVTAEWRSCAEELRQHDKERELKTAEKLASKDVELKACAVRESELAAKAQGLIVKPGLEFGNLLGWFWVPHLIALRSFLVTILVPIYSNFPASGSP